MNIAILGGGNVGLAFANMLQTQGHHVNLGSRNPGQLKQKLISTMPQHSFAFNICDPDSALEKAK